MPMNTDPLLPAYQRLSPDEAIRWLRRVRAAYPHHRYRETGFEGIYRRRLPFYRRYVDYLVSFVPGGSWAFYATEDDLVLDPPAGTGRPEFVVSQRDPLLLTEQTAPAYVHLLACDIDGYVYDPGFFTFFPDTSEIHRAMVREYVRPPRFDHADAQGVHWVNATFYWERNEENEPCSLLSEVAVGVDPRGAIVEGEARPLVQNLHAYRRRLR
jgi:SAM-dependent methyltransferase